MLPSSVTSSRVYTGLVFGRHQASGSGMYGRYQSGLMAWHGTHVASWPRLLRQVGRSAGQKGGVLSCTRIELSSPVG